VSRRPAISVVIPTCNRPALLAQCLDHLLQSMRRAGVSEIEVIVTDDSAGAETAQLVRERYPWAHWVAGPRGGPARNRNHGVSRAHGDWILFTDDDCQPAEGWLAAFAAAIGSAGAVRVFEGRTVADRDQRRLDEEAPINLQGGYLWACNMAIERRLFEHLGGFCESFPYAGVEDTELRVRLEKAGETFPFVAEAVVCHPLRPSKGLAYQMKVARSYLLLAERHPELLGEMPWRNAALNFLRRSRSVLKLANRLRFRGFGFALGSLAIATGSELMAVFARRRVRAE